MLKFFVRFPPAIGAGAAYGFIMQTVHDLMESDLLLQAWIKRRYENVFMIYTILHQNALRPVIYTTFYTK